MGSQVSKTPAGVSANRHTPLGRYVCSCPLTDRNEWRMWIDLHADCDLSLIQSFLESEGMIEVVSLGLLRLEPIPEMQTTLVEQWCRYERLLYCVQVQGLA